MNNDFNNAALGAPGRLKPSRTQMFEGVGQLGSGDTSRQVSSPRGVPTVQRRGTDSALPVGGRALPQLPRRESDRGSAHYRCEQEIDPEVAAGRKSGSYPRTTGSLAKPARSRRGAGGGYMVGGLQKAAQTQTPFNPFNDEDIISSHASQVSSPSSSNPNSNTTTPRGTVHYDFNFDAFADSQGTPVGTPPDFAVSPRRRVEGCEFTGSSSSSTTMCTPPLSRTSSMREGPSSSSNPYGDIPSLSVDECIQRMKSFFKEGNTQFGLKLLFNAKKKSTSDLSSESFSFFDQAVTSVDAFFRSDPKKAAKSLEYILSVFDKKLDNIAVKDAEVIAGCMLVCYCHEKGKKAGIDFNFLTNWFNSLSFFGSFGETTLFFVNEVSAFCLTYGKEVLGNGVGSRTKAREIFSIVPDGSIYRTESKVEIARCYQLQGKGKEALNELGEVQNGKNRDVLARLEEDDLRYGELHWRARAVVYAAWIDERRYSAITGDFAKRKNSSIYGHEGGNTLAIPPQKSACYGELNFWVALAGWRQNSSGNMKAIIESLLVVNLFPLIPESELKNMLLGAIEYLFKGSDNDSTRFRVLLMNKYAVFFGREHDGQEAPELLAVSDKLIEHRYDSEYKKALSFINAYTQFFPNDINVSLRVATYNEALSLNKK